MQVNIQFDAYAQGAPQGFRDAILAAADLISQTFIDPITVNLVVGYGEVNGSSVPASGAEAEVASGHSYSYSFIRSLLAQDLDGAVQSGVSALPIGTSIQGQSRVGVWSAEEKALGLISATNTAVDGYAGFGKNVPLSVLEGVALHELTHAMGRVPDVGGSSPPDVFDLYRFSSQGTRLYGYPSTAPAAYFSLDNGVTHLADYGMSSDPSDFLTPGSGAQDSFDEYYGSKTLQQFTSVDLLQMQALGFHLQPQTVVTTGPPPPSDFNGDRYSDVVFQNPSTGEWGYAALGAGGYGWDSVGNAGPSYAVKAVGDFNGDGIADVVFQNASTGQFGFAAMQPYSYAWVNVGNATPAYAVAGAGDFNGDGFADILFQNHATGQFGFAAMHPGGYTWVNVGNSTAAYSVAGVGDFNHDGIADILFQNSATGDWGYAAMNASGYTWVHEGNAGAGYAIAGVGDFNGDGLPDIIFRNGTTGDWGYATVTASGYNWSHVGVFDADYSIVARGDYNKDGVTDVAFRDNATGDWGVIAMNNHGGTWYDMGNSGSFFAF